MNIKVKKRNGRLEDFEVDKINASAQRACEGVSEVSASEIVLDAQLQLYDKITTSEIDKALVLSAREKIEKEPSYSYAAAKLLLNCLYKEVFKDISSIRVSINMETANIEDPISINDEIAFFPPMTGG